MNDTHMLARDGGDILADSPNAKRGAGNAREPIRWANQFSAARRLLAQWFAPLRDACLFSIA